MAELTFEKLSVPFESDQRYSIEKVLSFDSIRNFITLNNIIAIY